MARERTSVSVREWTTENFTREEIYAMVNISELKQYEIGKFDPAAVANILFNLGLVNRQCYLSIINRSWRSDNIFTFLFRNVTETLSFDDIVHVLNCLDLAELAKALLSERGNLTWVRQRPNRVDLPNGKFILRFYQEIKAAIDNRTFSGGAKQWLKNRISAESEKLALSRIQYKRQTCLDKLVALYVLLMQHVRNITERKRLLENMYLRVTPDLDKSALDLVYHGKMAVTEALVNNIGNALDHARQAKIKMEHLCPCFATISALHDIQYMHRAVYDENSHSDVLKEVVNAGHIMMGSLCEEPDSVQVLWSRISLSFIIFCYLKIGSMFEMFDISSVQPLDIDKARHAIQAVEKFSDPMQKRRKLILDLARARVLEQTDVRTAKEYAKDALKLSLEVEYFKTETTNIRNYYFTLLGRSGFR